MDPMRMRLDAYHMQAVQNTVPRFRAGTTATGADGTSTVDVSMPGSSDVLGDVGVAPNVSDGSSGLAAGWPVMLLEGGSKPLIVAQSPWQVGGAST